MLKGDNKHRVKWNIGIVEELYEEKDNVIRAVKFRLRKKYIERPIQFLYPHELSYDTWKRLKNGSSMQQSSTRCQSKEFKPRRNAAAIAEVRIRDAGVVNKDKL